MLGIDICNTCAEQWLIRAFKMQFEYEDAPLYVIKKEKGDAVESEEEDSTKEMVQQSKKSINIMHAQTKPIVAFKLMQKLPYNAYSQSLRGSVRSNL